MLHYHSGALPVVQNNEQPPLLFENNGHLHYCSNNYLARGGVSIDYHISKKKMNCLHYYLNSDGRLHYYSNIIWPGGVSIDYNYLKIMNCLHYYLNNDGRLHYYLNNDLARGGIDRVSLLENNELPPLLFE